MVEVFKTNVKKPKQAKQVIAVLQQSLPGSKINFDLDDCDKILRIEGSALRVRTVETLVRETGFACNTLE